jgi:hypothetical protein
MSNWPVMQPTGVVGAALGLDAANSRGTAVTDATADGSATTAGSWVEFSSALPYSTVGFHVSGTHGAEFEYVEVGVGAGGSEKVVAEFWYRGAPHGESGGSVSVYLPVAVNKGQRVAVRIRSASWASRTAYLALTPVLASWLHPVGYSGIATLAAKAANDAGGTAHTLSAWTQVVASTAKPAKALIISIKGYHDNASTAIWNVGVGAAASEIIVGAGVLSNWGYYSHSSTILIPVDVPAGSRVAFRHQASSNAVSSLRNLDYCIHYCY